jgi:2'-5' RNA ligase
VFWIGVEAGPELGALAGRIDEALVELGVPAERRPYSPHLTLARIDGQAPLQRLHRTIQDLDSVEFGSFRPDRFYLYRSQPGPGGSVYTRIREFDTTS